MKTKFTWQIYDESKLCSHLKQHVMQFFFFRFFNSCVNWKTLIISESAQQERWQVLFMPITNALYGHTYQLSMYTARGYLSGKIFHLCEVVLHLIQGLAHIGGCLPQLLGLPRDVLQFYLPVVTQLAVKVILYVDAILYCWQGLAARPYS